ncbi:TetR/AcrR family transcriptional regulator [Pedobacter sp. KBW06]|uniref:TetR/AcrR family transcriptional regulator n=1 Tax=Pedobacter sp. KBW06 TaxID=2153359 RepID=UPI000F5B2F7F|nr:TetR/AcrR family transcriptional regulator [Pedobacter sp. KBW06]RQO74525.1 TetR/AcrR family transcriptional regulator [Pedobacter sp. KBW06]
MTRKYDGALKNKERTKQKFLDAVGEIIKKDGYTALKLRNIEAVAGVDRKLLYDYFGSINNLVESYIRQKDFYMGLADKARELVKENESDFGNKMIQKILIDQLDCFIDDDYLQQIVLWHISEPNELLTEISEEREKVSRIFVELTDPHFEGTDVDIRARLALIAAGIYFLVLYAKKTDVLFCGIGMNTAEGVERIKKAISSLTEEAYSLADRQKKGY